MIKISKRGTSILSLFIAIILLVSGCSCGQKSVESLSVKQGTLEYNYVKDSEYSFDDLKVIVTYNDGTNTEVGKDELEISEFSTSTVGNHKVTISYGGKSIDVTLRVVNSQDDLATIIGYETPNSIVTRNTAKSSKTEEEKESEYYNRDNIYVVGDDNEFKFFPEITAIDTNRNPTTVNTYRSISTIYLYENDQYRELTSDELSRYVDEIDEVNSTYDFSSNAIGKQFKLVVTPDPTYYGENTFTTSLEFEVVDGYNINDVKQLGVISNYYNLPGESTCDSSVDVLSAWATFLANNNITRTSSPSAIILHNNFTITTDDIPSVFFYDNNGTTYLCDYYDLYTVLVEPDSAFTIYGNYFTIDASQLPLIDTSISQDGVSHETIFKFLGRQSFGETHIATTNVIIRDLSIIGNGNRENNNDGFGGLIMNKFSYLTGTIENSIIKSFYINTFTEDRATLNLNQVKSYDAYQNLIFSYGGEIINVTNSELKRTGGPAILLQHVNPTDNPVTNIPQLVVDSNSTIESYVNGEEAWFSYLKVSSLATNVISLDNVIKGYSGGNSTMTQDGKINLIAVSMTNNITTPGAQGKVTIGEKEVINMMSGRDNEPVPNTIAQTNGTAPVFQSSEGGSAYYNGQTLNEVANYDNFFKGDYLGIYYNGLGITVGYFHS